MYNIVKYQNPIFYINQNPRYKDPKQRASQPPQQKMSQNILSICPFQPSALQIISQKICQILNKYPTKQNGEKGNIQIEFKYAEFVSFCESYLDREHLPADVKKKVYDVASKYIVQQNLLHYQTLKKLSHNNLILLNSLTRRVYTILGGFDQRVHRKFYKIRQFLVNLCNQNSNSSHNPQNFYLQIQKTNQNRTFKILNESELRFDVNVKQGEHAGRYSYEVGKGWTKTVKENLIKEDFDLMIAEKTFRLAIKREEELSISAEQVLDIVNQQNSGKGRIFLRFKRALRVIKNNQIEIALSQIYQPENQRRNQLIEDLKDILGLQSSVLDDFCCNVFQQFYMHQPSQPLPFSQLVNKFQIQSQFLPAGLQKISQLHKSKNYRQLDRYIETTLHDLYALSFVDHNVKKRETNVMNEMIKGEGRMEVGFPECRLENQFGSYMHDVIYQYMNTQ